MAVARFLASLYLPDLPSSRYPAHPRLSARVGPDRVGHDQERLRCRCSAGAGQKGGSSSSGGSGPAVVSVPGVPGGWWCGSGR